MRKLSEREKRVVAIGAVAVCLIVLANWVLLPVSRRWAELGDRLEPKIARLDALRERARRYGALMAARRRLVGAMGTLAAPGDKTSGAKQGEPAASAKQEGKSPPAAAKTGLEAELEKMAGQAGVAIKGLSAGKRPARSALKHFRKVALHLQVQGNIDPLIKLLHALEKGERFVRVDAMTLHHDLQKPGELNVTLDLVAYERADQA